MDHSNKKEEVTFFSKHSSQSEGKRILFYSLPLFILLIGYAVPTYFVLKKHDVAAIELLVALLVGFSYPIYRFTGSYKVAGHYLIINGLLIVMGLVLLTGGLQGPSSFWFTLIPFFAALILGKSSLKTHAVLTFMVMILFHWFDSDIKNLSFTIRDQSYLEGARTRTIYAMFFFTIIMSSIYERLITSAYGEIKKDKKRIQELLRLLSHDLFNYLTIIRASTKRLKNNKDNDPEKKNTSLNKIENSLGSIEALLHHIKEAEALKSGKVQLELGPIDLKKALFKSLQLFDDQFKEKGIEIEIKEFTHTKILAEPVTLETQILNNLISNSLKFSSRGEKIEFSACEQGDSVAFTIRDHGIGMGEQLLDHIFEDDIQASRLGTSGEKGTGFGMAIIRNYVGYLGGSISLKSRCISEHPEDHGTTITITFKKSSSP